MQMRNISMMTQHASKFYAQNVTIIPLYNRIFVDGRPRMRPEGFDGDTCEVDPDLPIYRQHWIEHNAHAVAHALEIENWVRMGGNSFISFNEWKNLDIFEREALKIYKNKISKEIEKDIKQKEADLNQKLENAKEYKSPFAGTPRTPSFIR